MNDFYEDWGYVSNPFITSPLTAGEKGSELLIGREKEKRKLVNRLKSDSGIVTIEGANGIGKTSIVNVASYELFEDSLKQKSKKIFIPCKDHFQLSANCDVNEFIDSIYFSIAQTILDKSEYFKTHLRLSASLETWLNAPEIETIQAQVAGFGFGHNSSLNTSEGYSKSGFKKEIKDCLKSLFPSKDFGFMICMIDNLELLKSSDKAKEVLEVLRDELFTIKGVKWIFSGSHGIIRSLVSSSRLSGFLLKPIVLDEVKSIYVPKLLTSRINSFKSHIDDIPYAPFTDEDFVSLYSNLDGNLREVFTKISSYCLDVYESDREPDFPAQKNKRFEKWLSEERYQTIASVRDVADSRSLKLLKLIIKRDGNITKSKLKKLDFENIKAVLESIDQLESAGLVSKMVYQLNELERLNSSYGEYKISEGQLLGSSEKTELKEATDDILKKIDQKAKNVINGSLNNVLRNILVLPKGYFIYNKL
ncbi:hypothetical protein BFR04_17030 [Gaetbulibacter sp. 4G1]|nr:ATP-binding protein [Gaetbulibacter sp. 4G1]PIA80364.1 hypothetical protein BFR04_17030 [Gaetbulibacter sp. 4G1]